MKRFTKPLLVLVVVAFAAAGIHSVVTTEQTLQLREVQLKSTTSELKQLQLKYDHLNIELENTDKKNGEKIKQLEKEKQDLDAERKRLEQELAVKREKQRIAKEQADQASRVAINSATGTATASAAPAYTGGGNKEAWLAASGIPRSEWGYVDAIVSRESGWNPCAYNPGRSDCNANPTSACGLAQSLPCGKQSKYGHWTDPVANLKWQYEYVKGRYGGYAQAVAFWNANKWY